MTVISDFESDLNFIFDFTCENLFWVAYMIYDH